MAIQMITGKPGEGLSLPLTYQQGFHIASECIRYRNPYRPGTSEFDNFERGFFQARKRGIKPSRFFRRACRLKTTL